MEEPRFTRLKIKLSFWTQQTFRFLYPLLLTHILTKAIISANHMWFRTGMAGGILFKLVSRHLNQLLNFCHQEWYNMSEKLAKENHNIGWPFSGVVTAYTLHQHSSSLQPMSMVRFYLQQYPQFIAMQWSSGWRDVMGIAAIDCAQEENMPTCREYEVTNQILDRSLKKWLKFY